VHEAPKELRGFVVEWVRWLLTTEYRDDLLAAHLNSATDVSATVAIVSQRLKGISD
jgi:hypothetical protein